MGCDIHMFVEYKVDNGPWEAHPGHEVTVEYEGTEDEYEHITEVTATGRNYDLFGVLAGVRRDGPDPRGLPDDVSKLVKRASDNWDIDAHSHSWVTLEEFEEVLRTMDYPKTDSTDMFYDWRNMDWDKRPPDYTTIITACKQHAKELSQVDKILLDSGEGSVVKHRLVFFFDN